MSRVYSAKICNGEPVARLSNVGRTDPSIEFSIGTQANAASEDRTISSAADGLAVGNHSNSVRGTSCASTMPRKAASVKVPSGPR